MKFTKKSISVLLLFLIANVFLVEAKIVLPSIFSDHMVLQRNEEVKLWGWANVEEEITITTSWDAMEYKVKGTTDAKWSLQIETPEAGGPYTISFKGTENEIILKNILIGEVWVCSGQSNMEWSANNGIKHMEEVYLADYPNIRLFDVDRRTAVYPQDDLPGNWEVCTPEAMKSFSAVGYFFAKKLHAELNIPIGIINSSWGASSSEVWTPKSVFNDNDVLAASAKKIKANPWVSNKPSELYNAMLHPIISYKIAGSLWYQGESNTDNPDTYTEQFTSMISAWRDKWGYKFPFYFVQIAPYNYGELKQGVLVRNAQRKALELNNTGMVVISDIGNVENIHPKNKLEVGIRLANIALKDHYKSITKEVYGPLYKELQINGKKATVLFKHAEGLYIKGKKLTHFEIAGADGIFLPAKAVIKEDKVIVSSRKVKEPKIVRYAWHNKAVPNLFNGVNLPTTSFISE